MLKPEFTVQFKHDYKKAIKSGCSQEKFVDVLKLLVAEKVLPRKYKDHILVNSRNYKGMRECHIEPDWLLVYQVVKDRLLLRLIRTGTYSDLFK